MRYPIINGNNLRTRFIAPLQSDVQKYDFLHPLNFLDCPRGYLVLGLYLNQRSVVIPITPNSPFFSFHRH